MTFFYSFGVEHIPERIERIKGKKYLTTKIYRKQVYDSLICGYFYLGFIVFALNNKSCQILLIYFLQTILKRMIIRYLTSFNNSNLEFVFYSKVKTDLSGSRFWDIRA